MTAIKKWGLCGTTLSCLVAIVVCVICDYCLSGRLSWSMVTALSVILGWIVIFPIFKAENKVVKKCLISVSILIIPYLLCLSAILQIPVIGAMGSLIAVLSIMASWAIYAFFVKYPKRIFRAIALSLLVVIPLACGITHVSSYFLETVHIDPISDLFHVITTLVLSAICFTIDFAKEHTK